MNSCLRSRNPLTTVELLIYKLHFVMVSQKRRKWHKYQTLPLALLIYTIVMSVYGWDRYHFEGNMVEYWSIIGVELLIIVVLYFLLRRQYRHRRKLHEDAEEL